MVEEPEKVTLPSDQLAHQPEKAFKLFYGNIVATWGQKTHVP